MLKRGSFITSIAKEMAKLGCTRANLRTARKVLESCTMINLSSSRAGTLIEITNFNDWQDWEKIRNQATDQELTKQPPRANQQLTNRPPQQNKGNKGKNDNNLSAGAHENENGRGCKDFKLYKLYVKDGCPNIADNDIKDSWRLGLHFKEAVELFSTENP